MYFDEKNFQPIAGDLTRGFRKDIENLCLENEPPFCTSNCPFELDVLDFMAKVQRGGTNGAYRTYSNTVAFPEIVSRFCDAPCKKACIRSQVDGAVDMKKIEAMVVKNTRNNKPNSYHMPPKNIKIAVIGAGLAGLGCALRLCSKKYDVTIYEARDRKGGHLWDLCPDGSFMEEIDRQLQFEKFDLQLGKEITSLDEIEFDAAFIATGAGGEKFGLELTGEGAYATNRPGVFMAGMVTGSTLMEALADGLSSIHAIERYLKTGAMNQPYKQKGTRLKMNTDLIRPMEPVLTEEDAFTKEEAIEEAKRCLKCKCDACKKGCDLMNYYNKYPRRIEEEVEITVHPGTLDGEGTIATRLMATCNKCGRCKVTCPVGLDVGRFLIANHRVMYNKGTMPWVFHEFWLRDFEFTCSEQAQMFRNPVGVEKSRYAFFPGCRLGTTLPEIVKATYAKLLEKYSDTALMLSCCGAPAQWAGDKPLFDSHLETIKAEWEKLGRPTVILACESCIKMFREFLPDIPLVSLYTFIEAEKIEGRKLDNMTVSVFDPCASRDDEDAQKAVRTLAQQTGYTLEPIATEGKYAACCSYGGQINLTNPRYAGEVAKARISQNDLPYAVYCVNCRDTFASHGKPVFHILEAMFGEGEIDMTKQAPSPTQSRKNRWQLKADLLKTYWNEEVTPMAENSLYISDELKEKLSRDLILEEDICEVVAYCETSGYKLYDAENNVYIGHKRVGHMTFWAVYRTDDNGTTLVNAYGHRMNIAED